MIPSTHTRVHPVTKSAEIATDSGLLGNVSQESSVRHRIRKKSKHFEIVKKIRREDSESSDGDDNLRKKSIILRKASNRAQRYGYISDIDEDGEDMKRTYTFSSTNNDMTLETQTIIKKSLMAHYLFTEFTVEALAKFINAMQLNKFKSGDTVCREGEIGQKFFVIVEGMVKIEVENNQFGHLRAGDTFGEIALLHGCTHVRHVIAESDCELWSITRGPFRELLRKNQSSKLLRVGQFMRKNKLFTNLNSKQIAIAAEAFVLQIFPDNTVIIREGESDVDVFYILLSGTIRVTRSGKFIRSMTPGVVFGARSLIQKESRTATCTSVGVVECFAATKSHFERVLEIPLKCAINSKQIGSSDSKQRQSPSDSPSSSERKIPRKSLSDTVDRDRRPLKYSSKPRHFECHTILGKGGFGLIVLAKHKSTKTPIVLKICTATTQKAYVVASRERRLLSELHHRHIVHMFNSYERRGTKEITLVLEYLQGGDLFNLLLKMKVFNFEMTRFYAASAYNALCFMHRRHVICRDLKLENLALTPDGVLKLIDLGLAKLTTKKCYTMCGSPEIIAPEMISNTGYYREIDFWALGVLVHEMAVGRAPFGDRNSYSSVHKSVIQYSRMRRAMRCKSTELESIAELLPHLSRCKQGYTTASFVYRLLHPQPSLRLGCTSFKKRDFEGHMFFQTKRWSWTDFITGAMDIPYVPSARDEFKGPFDSSMFDNDPSQDDIAMLNHAMRHEEQCCSVM